MAPSGESTVRYLVLEELQAGNMVTLAEGGRALSLSEAQNETWAGFSLVGLSLAPAL